MPIYTGNTTVNSAITSTSLTEMSPQSYQVTNALRNAVRPTLLLPFNESTGVDPRITFTRASSATYFNNLGVITTAASNVPRIDYNPSTLVCNGLLIEQSSVNLVLQSTFQSGWSGGAAAGTLTANQLLSPDGTVNAAQYVESTAASSFHYKAQNVTKAASALVYTFSVFLKASGNRQVGLRMQDTGGTNGAVVTCDPVAGTIATAGVYGTFTSASGTMQTIGNGWYRFSLTATSSTDTLLTLQLETLSAGTNVYTGDGVSGFYCFGAQVEQLAFPTSYIATAGASATRSADLAIISGTNFSSWYNTTAATVMAEVIQESSSGGVQLQFSDNSTNKLNMSTNSTTVAFYDYYSVSSTLDVSISATYSGSSFKSIGAISGALSTTGTIALVVNGGTAVTGTTGNYPGAAFTQLALGYALGGTYLNGWIQRIAYWPIAMTNTQLQAMSS